MGGNISKASDCCEVAEAHSSLGQAYEGYAKSVLENSVDGATLLTLKTREELCAFLEALGVANLVHRTVLAAHVLRAGETGSDVQPSQSAPGTVFAAPAPTVLVPEGTRRRIFRAAEEADMAVLRPLVEEWKRHADVVDWVNPDSPFGYTPLLAACDAGATEAVRLLVMAPGASPSLVPSSIPSSVNLILTPPTLPTCSRGREPRDERRVVHGAAAGGAARPHRRDARAAGRPGPGGEPEGAPDHPSARPLCNGPTR